MQEILGSRINKAIGGREGREREIKEEAACAGGEAGWRKELALEKEHRGCGRRA